MPLAIPPEQELKEIRALMTDSTPPGSFSGLRVLELGAGNGRLAWPFASEARLWVCLDVDPGQLASAAEGRLGRGETSLHLLAGDACALGFAAETFEVAFFSWSLCCLTPAAMGVALGEAHRILKDGGLLLDLHATEDPLALEVWHTSRPGNSRSGKREKVQRLPVGCLDPAGEPHGFLEATDALAAALETGDFYLRSSRAFEYRYFFDSLDELRGHLAGRHEHATLSQRLAERAKALISQAPVRPKVVTLQRVAITALQKA